MVCLARDRNRDGRCRHVLEHEVVLCEDHETVMVYLYFGAPGDDPREVDVGRAFRRRYQIRCGDEQNLSG